MSNIKKPKKSLMYRKTRHAAKKAKLAIKKRIKKMKKGTKIFLVILISSLLIFGTYKLVDMIIFESKNNFSVEEVERAVRRIYKDNMWFKSNISVRFEDEKDRYVEMPGYWIISRMSDDHFVISSNGGDSFFVRHYKPTEITATFECLLYFDGKNLPGAILGITNSQTSGGLSNYYSNKSFISMADYKVLREKIDISGMSRRKAAKKLAEAWIEKHNYVKR